MKFIFSFIFLYFSGIHNLSLIYEEKMKKMQILFLNKGFFLKNYKILFLLFILFLIFYRSPYIFLNGRFIAEEGSFWFRNAFLFGPVCLNNSKPYRQIINSGSHLILK